MKTNNGDLPAMQKEFEEWAVKQKCHHGIPYFVMKDDSGLYIDHGANIAWQAWQASRAALVVELPRPFLDRYEQYVVDDFSVRSALDDAGIKYND